MTFGNKEKWTSDGFDASDWEKVDVFNSNWGGSWNTPLNGVHYFRQRINIPESLAGQQAVLRVGTLKRLGCYLYKRYLCRKNKLSISSAYLPSPDRLTPCR